MICIINNVNIHLQVIAVLCSGAKAKFTISCDVWSFGIVVWELYSGNIAYHDILEKPDIHILQSYFLEVSVFVYVCMWA